jgi:signal peptidase II
LSSIADPVGPEPDLDRPSGAPADAGVESVAPVSVVQRPSIVFLVVVAGLSAAADLASKYWAKEALSHPTPQGTQTRHVVFQDLFGSISLDMLFAQNPGGAFSMMRSLPEVVRRPFFLYVSAAATVFLVAMYMRVDRRHRALVWGLPLALGGAIGNLVDRVRYGWVIDFIHFWVRRPDREHHWPTFNVADIAIVVGVGLLTIDLVFGKRGAVAAASTRS